MKTLAFVAAPHVGTLDSWLPIAVEVRRRHPDWRLLMVLPRPERAARTLNPEDAGLKAFERISDEILMLGIDGRFYSPTTLLKAADLSRSQWALGVRIADLPLLRGRVGLEPRSGERFRDGRAQCVFRWLLRSVFLLRYARHRSRRALIGSLGDSVVCTDFTKIGRGSASLVMEAFGAARQLSIEHGLGLKVVEDDDPASVDVMRRIGARTDHLRTAYWYSEQMARSSARRFGLRPDQCVVSGVPRHDRESDAWRREVSSGAHYARPVVPVISRVTTSQNLVAASETDRLPSLFKQMMLREIHDFCRTIGATMLVRLHPSEVRSSSLEEIETALQDGGSEVEWAVTSAHPSELAEAALFAVTFSSALQVEFVAFDVPVIDLSPGAPTIPCPAARAGLAVIAQDVPTLRLALSRIVADRDQVLCEQKAAYRARFADPTGAVDRIIQDLEESFPD